MNCYFVGTAERKDTIFISGESFYIFESECPEDKIAAGETLIHDWEIGQSKFWKCVARSDNGIDDSRSERCCSPISFEILVFDGERFIGVFLPEQKEILSFIDNAKSKITVITKEEFVGGWGDISEGYSYWLSKKNR